MTKNIRGKLKFPISYRIKIIMDTVPDCELNKDSLRTIFDELNISHSDWIISVPGTGKYTKFDINIVLQDEVMMQMLYDNLGKCTGLRSAI